MFAIKSRKVNLHTIMCMTERRCIWVGVNREEGFRSGLLNGRTACEMLECCLVRYEMLRC